jgi:hypothetical protein
LGSDFNRFGLAFVHELMAYDASNQDRKAKLEELNSWRNAIAHQDFSKPELHGKATISLSTVKSWRVACRGLATSMDEIMRRRLSAIFGLSPW